MFAKNSGNAWNGKGKLLEADQKSATEKWPQLGKSRGPRTENNIERWPRVGKSNRLKSEDGNNTQKNLSGSENQKIEIKMQRARTAGIRPENKEAPKKPVCATNIESMSGKPRTSLERCDTSQKYDRPSGDSEGTVRSNKAEKKLIYKKLAKEKREVLMIEKQRKKEDDAFRKLVGPKGISVTVMDTSTFSKFSNQPANSCLKDTVNPTSVQLDSTAFPNLGSRSRRYNVKGGNDINIKKFENYVKVRTNASSIPNEEKNTDGGKIKDEDLPSVSKPRRRDPVLVDIIKAIEICNLKKRAAEENVSGVLASKRKEKKVFHIGGNLLDSSNPSRFRGKKREAPKKRNATPLKKAILAERERRRRQRNLKNIETKEKDVVNCNSIEVKNENVAGFSDSVMSNIINESLQVNKSGESISTDRVAVRSLSNKMDNDLDVCLLKPADDTLDIDRMAKESLHGRKFREYCNHSTSAELSEGVRQMLADIIRFQDTLYANQPIKAQSHRRYVVGLRQTQNLLTVHKVKVVIMASDLEKVPSPGGLDEVVNAIIDTANRHNVPVVFPFLRRTLGKATYRKVGVSCVGVLNYQGSENNFQKMMSALKVAKCDYQEKFEKERCRIMSELGLPNIKQEEEDDDVALPVITEPNVNLPLLQKLTEMISELSRGTSSRIKTEEESCDL